MPTMYPVIMSKNMTARLPDGITMESSTVTTIQLPVLNREVRQTHISPQ